MNCYFRTAIDFLLSDLSLCYYYPYYCPLHHQAPSETRMPESPDQTAKIDGKPDPKQPGSGVIPGQARKGTKVISRTEYEFFYSSKN